LPLQLAAVALALRAVYECVNTFVDQQPVAYSSLCWWQIAASITLPLALLADMLRARLARANVGELVLALDRASATPQRLQQARVRWSIPASSCRSGSRNVVSSSTQVGQLRYRPTLHSAR
jgi:hypothetical protein